MKNSIDRGVIISFVVGALILAGMIAGVVILDSNGDPGSEGSADLTQGEPNRNETGYLTYPESYADRVVRTVIQQASASEQGSSTFTLEQWTAYDGETEPRRLAQIVREGDGSVVLAVQGDRDGDTGRRYNSVEGQECTDVNWETASRSAAGGLPAHLDAQTREGQGLSEGGAVSDMLSGSLENDVESSGEAALVLAPELDEATAWTREQTQGEATIQQTTFTDPETDLLIGTQLQRSDARTEEVTSAELNRVALLAIYSGDSGGSALESAIDWDSFCDQSSGDDSGEDRDDDDRDSDDDDDDDDESDDD